MKKMKFRYSQPINSDTFELGTGRHAPDRTLIEAIAVTAEVCGHSLSPAAVNMLAGDLSDFDETAILSALSRCRMELHGRLRLSDILVRIDDGRPDAEQAWEMLPKSELASVVWTDEMARASGAALPLLSSGDVSGARTAFRDAYTKAVLEARMKREPVRWIPSLGTSVADRASVLLDAVKKGRLAAAHAEKLLPPGAASAAAQACVAQVSAKSLH
jgi:hypothetical protein